MSIRSISVSSGIGGSLWISRAARYSATARDRPGGVGGRCSRAPVPGGGQCSRHKHRDPSQKMILRNAIIEAELIEQLALVPSLATHHHRALPVRWRADGITVRQASQRL